MILEEHTIEEVTFHKGLVFRVVEPYNGLWYGDALDDGRTGSGLWADWAGE
jgi:hypothetical protein